MILREALTAVTIAVVVGILAIGFASSWLANKFDGPIEEVCEMIAEQQLGLEPGTIDLSPGSPEG